MKPKKVEFFASALLWYISLTFKVVLTLNWPATRRVILNKKEKSRRICTKSIVIYPCHKFTVPNGKFRTTTFYIFIHNAICNTIWMIYNYKIMKKKNLFCRAKENKSFNKKAETGYKKKKKKKRGNIFKIKENKSWSISYNVIKIQVIKSGSSQLIT